MATQSFRDLIVWQKAGDFSTEVYKQFRNLKDFSFRDQIQRAAISIPNNIAEGYARRSDKSLRNFLLIAKGSAVEVESMLFIAYKLGYINLQDSNKLVEKVQEIQKLLSGFIKKL